MLKENRKIFNDVKEFALDRIDECVGEYGCDIRNKLFNEDYFVYSDFEAEEIAQNWNIDAFELIHFNIKEENDAFGEVYWTKEENVKNRLNWSGQINLSIYWLGRDLLYEFNEEMSDYWDDIATEMQIEKLKTAMENLKWENL